MLPGRTNEALAVGHHLLVAFWHTTSERVVSLLAEETKRVV